MSDKKNYFTPEGHKRFVDELNQLLSSERPEILKVIQWAAGNGDRSENADYLYGKRRLREIDRRIRFLNSRLEKVVIVDPCSIKDSVVRFGATVHVMDEEENKKIFYIVGPDEVDTSKHKISFLSPIGRALMGKSVGDSIEVQSPSGTQDFEILKILYQQIPN